MGCIKSKENNLINNYYNNLESFECIICFEDNPLYIEKIKCKHQICKRCFWLKQDKQCLLCTKVMKPINKDNIKIKYLKEPYNEKMTVEQVETIKQLNLFNIQIDNINKINLIIGNLVLILKYEHNSIIIYYFPSFNNQKNQIIKNINNEHIILFYTLETDLKNKNYQIWYDNYNLYQWIMSYKNN